MRIPVGLAPGRFAGFEGDNPTLSDPQPLWPCGSGTDSEIYVIQFPPNVSITSIPKGIAYHDDEIDFHSAYRRVGRRVTVERTLVLHRPSQVCKGADLEHWRAFLRTLQPDLRSQIFYR